jgi:hypothetical protein
MAVGSPRLSGPQGQWTDPRQKAIIKSRADMEPGAHHAGDGGGGAQLKIDAIGVLFDDRKKLNAHDGDFFVNAFNIAGVYKLKRTGFVKGPAVEPVFAGILVAPGGACRFLFYHESL